MTSMLNLHFLLSLLVTNIFLLKNIAGFAVKLDSFDERSLLN